MKYEVRDVTRSDREPLVGVGDLSLGGGHCTLTDDSRLVAELTGATVTRMAAAGLWVTGYEQTGHDRRQRRVYILREWFCRYVTEGR